MKQEQPVKLQYRYYEVPPDSQVLALLGSTWIREYDNSVEFLHFHNCLEIGYCHSGGGTMTFGEDVFPYKEEMFTVIPAKYPHNTNSIVGQKCRWEFLFINLDGFLNKFFPDNSFIRKQLSNRINRQAHLFSHDEHPQIANLILSIMDEHRLKEDLFRENTSVLMQSLLIYIARLCSDDSVDIDIGRDVGPIAAAINYAEQNFSEKITVSMLADTCHMSESHFRRLFVQFMGISPLAYVNRMRIEAACRLLHTTNDSIGNIAVKCGFITITALNRNFKDVVGMTPTQWRMDITNYDRRLTNDNMMPYEGWR